MNIDRLKNCVLSALPGAGRTVLWLCKITLAVSFGVMLLRYFGILPVVASWLDPAFRHLGLSGDAALAYVTGFFVNVYAAISVAVSLGLDPRAMTILGVMVLCSHNMIVETGVQKKTGSPAVRIVVTRVLSAFLLAWLLNLILPGAASQTSASAVIADEYDGMAFTAVLASWAKGAVLLLLKMAVLIFGLNILQRILSEYGVVTWLSRIFHPLLAVFGLPRSSSFLWIVANTLGLAYGAAVMLDEASQGKMSRRDTDLLNMHICISHSNLEDLMLFVSVGGLFWPMLLSRLAMSLILVWELRLEYTIIDYISKKRANFAS